MDSLDTKFATIETNLVTKTVETLSKMLPYDKKIAQLEQGVQILASTLQNTILEKVTKYIESNINSIIPDLSTMRDGLGKISKNVE